MTGLQSRFSLGSLMSVEVVGGSSSNLYWPSSVLERGVIVGELVRRGMAAATSAYSGAENAPQVPPGLPQPGGSTADLSNAWISSMWVGDPLTVY